MIALLLVLLLGDAPAKEAPPELQVVINETTVASDAGTLAITLLKGKGYSVASKPIVGDVSARAKKKVKRLLKLEVMKPATCYVMATLSEAGGKTLFTWQTQNDAETCADQVKKVIEAIATKFPPSKP